MMKAKLINDDQEDIMIDFYSYERNVVQKDNAYFGIYLSQEIIELNIKKNKHLKSFLNKSYDIHIELYFDKNDQDNVRIIYSPNITLKDNTLTLEKLIEYNF